MHNKYKIYCQPINPPNYVIKTVQGNINCRINHEILTYYKLTLSLINIGCPTQYFYRSKRFVKRRKKTEFIFPMQIFEINKHMEHIATVL